MDDNDDQKVIKESEESRSSHSSSSESKSSGSSKSHNKNTIEETKGNEIKLTDSPHLKSKHDLNLKTNSESHDQSLLQSPIVSPNKLREEGGEEEEEAGDFDISYSPGKSPGHLKQDKMEIYMQQEEEIVRFCKENSGSLWMDETFPPDSRSLFKNPVKLPEWAKDVKTKWVRPNEISKDAKFLMDREGDVKQGAFGESAFIGGIVIIATRGDFLEKLFIDFDHFDVT